ncbi:MAG: YraN family protein [Thermoanaerobaculia bacterium]|nr:YraN family protein [Thermoanaerobaculia bacterium]
MTARRADTRSRGRAGEDEAVRHLESLGYRVLARNQVTRAGEIDIVAAEGDTLCFVEVKARRSSRHGPAVAAVGPAKQRRLARAAALYLAALGPSAGRVEVRFDVLGLELDGTVWRHHLVRDAFAAEALFTV